MFLPQNPLPGLHPQILLPLLVQSVLRIPRLQGTLARVPIASCRPRGEISRGRVRVKLSRARDPYYSSRSLADLIAAADAQGQGEEDLEDEEEDASWRWEGEDDFTLGHVWEVRSRDPKRAIVYVRPFLSHLFFLIIFRVLTPLAIFVEP
ncbi:hypothetical protein BGW80DRAFT_1301839 [Lactifluus volemus]|nr:hypothetical protein BGW80DRAFT_1301839 [Lactifluus volemus]